MAGRPALLGHEAQHQRRVEQRGVGRRQVAGDQHVGLVAVRHTRHRHAEQSRDDPVPHVVQVRDPARQVLPGLGQQRPVRGEGVVDRALGGAAHGDAPLDIGHQLGVLRHHGLGLQHRLRLAAGQVAARDQVGGDSVHRLPGAPLLALGLLRGNPLGRRLQHRRTHVPNLADRHTVAHADASQQVDSLAAGVRHQADRRVGQVGPDRLEPLEGVAGLGIERPVGEEHQEEIVGRVDPQLGAGEAGVPVGRLADQCPEDARLLAVELRRIPAQQAGTAVGALAEERPHGGGANPDPFGPIPSLSHTCANRARSRAGGEHARVAGHPPDCRGVLVVHVSRHRLPSPDPAGRRSAA